MTKVIYSWTFSNDKNRGSLWYVIALSVIIGLVIWGFITRQYILSFLVMVMSGVSFFIENNTPETTNVDITDFGIKIDSFFYEYEKISSFCVFYNYDIPEILRINLVKKSVRFLDLKITEENITEIKNILSSYIKEDETMEQSLSDKVIHWFKL